ncbi:MAG TPA: FxsA family protein [Solirubrobacteraceae bacterium]|nr:FxsA family protein [Solirubrobacteraceae bacterium]
MFVLLLIGVPILELFAFIEVGHAIGWRLALLLLLVGSVIGARLTRVQGRAAIERVSLAVSEHRPPARAAIDGALGFLGGVLLAVPGFVTGVFGALLLLPPTRKLTCRWILRHYTGRAMRVVAATGRFASRERGARPADVESTAVEDDLDQLDR